MRAPREPDNSNKLDCSEKEYTAWAAIHVERAGEPKRLSVVHGSSLLLRRAAKWQRKAKSQRERKIYKKLRSTYRKRAAAVARTLCKAMESLPVRDPTFRFIAAGGTNGNGSGKPGFN